MPRSVLHIGAVVLVFCLGGCASKNEKTTASSIDTTLLPPPSSSSQVVVPVEQVSNNEINLDSVPSRTIGEMILNEQLRPSDNNVTFRMIDSLNSDDKSSRPFYFLVFNKIMNHADGALSEAIGDYALNYVEQNPAEFIKYIMPLGENRFETWASHVGIELYLSSNDPKDSYQKFSQTSLSNCKGCDKSTQQKLQSFNSLVWQTMQANIKAEQRVR